MFLGEARRLCPALKVVSYDFPLYEALSEKVYKILLNDSDANYVEPVSVDEAYLEFNIMAGAYNLYIVIHI
jgi:nucleotidyltransferase/DNA polymerase involved in DNA repair